MKGRKKNVSILNYIARCLSFLSIALEWTRDKPLSSSVVTNSKIEPLSAGYLWGGTISDLVELAITIFKMKLIRNPTGKLMSYAEILQGFKLIFNIKLPPNIYSRKTRTMERKKQQSSILARMLAVYNHEVDQLYM